jgi:hypothetical protein
MVLHRQKKNLRLAKAKEVYANIIIVFKLPVLGYRQLVLRKSTKKDVISKTSARNGSGLKNLHDELFS